MINETVLHRNTYLDRVIPFIGKQIVKVLTGQRRVGKSYLLKQIINYISEKEPDANILYINKEDFEFNFIRSASDLHNYVISNSKKDILNYIMIDEIQEIAEFEKAIRSLLLKPNYDIYCTGSNAYILSSELSTFLSGRYIEFPVYSLSYNEFLYFHSLKNSPISLSLFLKYGGLPYLRNLTLSDSIVFDYLKGIYNTVIYRDVIKRNEIRNTAFLEDLIRFLADNTGQIFSAKKITEYLKSQQVQISTSQIINYLEHLVNACLIYKVKRMDVIGKKIFEIGEKFYFEDLGIRNSIIGYRQTDISKLMENAVFNHLLINGYDVKIGYKGDLEIDFVAKKNNEIIYIQVCYLLADEKTVEREFGNLERINDNYPKIVVSMDDFTGNTRNGIQHISLIDFLMKEV